MKKFFIWPLFSKFNCIDSNTFLAEAISKTWKVFGQFNPTRVYDISETDDSDVKCPLNTWQPASGIGSPLLWPSPSCTTVAWALSLDFSTTMSSLWLL